eukprot:m.145868 g.145868  ORF g.145868 m.145868 type:complete len:66 (-) comp16068_c1_seq1:647-844(-)
MYKQRKGNTNELVEQQQEEQEEQQTDYHNTNTNTITKRFACVLISYHNNCSTSTWTAFASDGNMR